MKSQGPYIYGIGLRLMLNEFRIKKTFQMKPEASFVCFKNSLIAVSICHFCGGIKQTGSNNRRNKNESMSADKTGQIRPFNSKTEIINIKQQGKASMKTSWHLLIKFLKKVNKIFNILFPFVKAMEKYAKPWENINFQDYEV